MKVHRWHHLALRTLRLVAVALVCVILLAPGTVARAQDGGPTPPDQSGSHVYLPSIASRPVLAGAVIPGQYIVVLADEGTRASLSSDGVAQAPAAFAADVITRYGGELLYVYDSAPAGFAAQLPPQAVVDLNANPAVAFVEPDTVVTLDAGDAVDATQTGATWGLDRIDQRALPLNGAYNYLATAANVRAFIIDTGILKTHTQFGSRVATGYDAVTPNGTAADCNGHGTHVAGTVGGATYGVAKGVTLVPVRVLDCGGSGTTSGVIAGINWVTNQKAAQPSVPAVANMSLGGGASTSLDIAVGMSISRGVVYAIAAGNSSANACNTSPARVAAAITVGATTSTDARASYSNFGNCLDIFAPGSSITSAWYTSTTATNTISGTSMATPHVTGVAALYLSTNPTASPATVASALTGGATLNKVTNLGPGSPNRLLFSSY